MQRGRSDSEPEMTKQKLVFRIILVFMPLVILAVNVFPALAVLEVQKKEVKLQLNKAYDVFIGNGGIFIDNSQYRSGTLVLKSEEYPEERKFLSWQRFTQRILDFRVYQEDGDPFEWVYGVVRVYFNLDAVQYDRWINKKNNMSIWYFDELAGGWRKCYTHWEATPGVPKGRLWCLVSRYTRYGLAWTQPTIIMKMVKFAKTKTVTATRTRTPSPTP